VQIAPELDEAFVSISDVLVDSRSRMWAAELVECHSHKDARVISEAQVDIRPLNDQTTQRSRLSRLLRQIQHGLILAISVLTLCTWNVRDG
jgi:hypothetical protein